MTTEQMKQKAFVEGGYLSRYDAADKLEASAKTVTDEGAKLRLLNMAMAFRTDTYLTPVIAGKVRELKQQQKMKAFRERTKQRGL